MTNRPIPLPPEPPLLTALSKAARDAAEFVNDIVLERPTAIDMTFLDVLDVELLSFSPPLLPLHRLRCSLDIFDALAALRDARRAAIGTAWLEGEDIDSILALLDWAEDALHTVGRQVTSSVRELSCQCANDNAASHTGKGEAP